MTLNFHFSENWLWYVHLIWFQIQTSGCSWWTRLWIREPWWHEHEDSWCYKDHSQVSTVPIWEHTWKKSRANDGTGGLPLPQHQCTSKGAFIRNFITQWRKNIMICAVVQCQHRGEKTFSCDCLVPWWSFYCRIDKSWLLRTPLFHGCWTSHLGDCQS